MRRGFTLLLTLLAVFPLMLWDAAAQTSTGVITGRVIDQQGTAVPGADVVLTQELTGVKLATKTETSGDFVFPSVQPGRYAVSVQAQGFKRLEKTEIVLTSSERLSVGSLSSQVGSLTESITVIAEATPVQTESQERSAVLNDKQMAYMSAAGPRLPEPAAPAARRHLSGRLRRELAGLQFAAHHSRHSQRLHRPQIDGVVANSRGLGTTENMLNLDSIAEVKVLMGNYQAEYGKNAGAIINAVTKNGTQNFHGAAYWYKRHEMFNATNFFDNRNGLRKGRSRYSSVGYNVGGPIWWPGQIQ